MVFFSESYFKRAASHMELFEQREFSARVRRDISVNAKFDVFLSYNIADIEVVMDIFYFFIKKRVEGLP